MAKDLTHVREGEAAYWNSEPYDDPPYEQRDFKCLDWQDGWLKAKADADRGEGPPGEEVPNAFFDYPDDTDRSDPRDWEDALDDDDTIQERQYADDDWHGWHPDDFFV